MEIIFFISRSYFYGHISPKEDPNGYIKIITLLYELYKQNSCSSKSPIVINQQGWARGRTYTLLNLFVIV